MKIIHNILRIEKKILRCTKKKSRVAPQKSRVGRVETLVFSSPEPKAHG